MVISGSRTGTPVREPPNDAPRMRGYRASNQVVVTTRDLTLVARLLNEATRADVDVTSALRFGLKDSNTAQTAALSEATREALARATAMADAIGKRLTRVVQIRKTRAHAPDVSVFRTSPHFVVAASGRRRATARRLMTARHARILRTRFAKTS
jgi:uncharacterized protein YggE